MHGQIQMVAYMGHEEWEELIAERVGRDMQWNLADDERQRDRNLVME